MWLRSPRHDPTLRRLSNMSSIDMIVLTASETEGVVKQKIKQQH